MTYPPRQKCNSGPGPPTPRPSRGHWEQPLETAGAPGHFWVRAEQQLTHHLPSPGLSLCPM